MDLKMISRNRPKRKIDKFAGNRTMKIILRKIKKSNLKRKENLVKSNSENFYFYPKSNQPNGCPKTDWLIKK